MPLDRGSALAEDEGHAGLYGFKFLYRYGRHSLIVFVDYADLDGNILVANDPGRGVLVEEGKLLLPKGPGLGLTQLSG